MRMMKLLLIVAACAALTACGGDTDKVEKSKTTSEISENVFHNAYAGVTVTKPADWYANNTEQNDKTIQTGTELAYGDDDSMKRLAKVSAKTTHIMFSFDKYAPGAPVDYNPSITGMFEDVTHFPGIKTGKDYLFHLKKGLSGTALNYEISKDYGQRVIGGQSFDFFDTKVIFNGQTIGQTYSAARHEGFVLLFIETFGPEAFRPETQAVLDTITLNWQE